MDSILLILFDSAAKNQTIFKIIGIAGFSTIDAYRIFFHLTTKLTKPKSKLNYFLTYFTEP